MEENDFTDKSLLKFYESDPFHKAFTGEIVCVYQKKWMENSCAFTRRNFFIYFFGFIDKNKTYEKSGLFSPLFLIKLTYIL